MIVFTVYYKSDGTIHSYQEGGAIPPDKETPKDCKRVCFDRLMKLSEKPGEIIDVRVDPATKQLVPINQPQVLD